MKDFTLGSKESTSDGYEVLYKGKKIDTFYPDEYAVAAGIPLPTYDYDREEIFKSWLEETGFSLYRKQMRG